MMEDGVTNYLITATYIFLLIKLAKFYRDNVLYKLVPYQKHEKISL